MNIRRKMQQSINFLTCLLDDKNISDNAMNIALNMKTLRSKIMLWINNGEKTFILSKELIEAFKHTDIPLSVSPADFKYPFDTFVIEGEVPLFQTDNGMIDVQSILFTHSRLAYSSGAVIAEPGGKTREKLEWDISISALHDTGPGMGLDHMWLNLSNEKTVEELYHVPSLTALGRNPVQKSEAQLTINMFYNTLMYIHDETRDVGATEVQKTRRMKNETGKKRHKKGYIYPASAGFIQVTFRNRNRKEDRCAVYRSRSLEESEVREGKGTVEKDMDHAILEGT